MYDEVSKTKEGTTKKRKNDTKMMLKKPVAVAKKMDNNVEIFSVVISGTQLKQVLTKIWLQRKEMLHVATVNPEYIMEARENPKFRETLTKCLTVADGHGVVWASKLLGKPRIDRISGVELAGEILAHAAESGEKVFLLGARQGIAEKAASVMMRKYPGLKIAWFAGAETVKVEKDEEASMTIAKINGYEPDYLFVAYGSPWQDLWIEENRPYLRVRVAMGVGGTLDEWSGYTKSGPKWIDMIGLKWLWRLGNEPWRLSRIMRVVHFGILVLYHKVID